MDHLLADILYAARALRKNPGFAIVTLATLSFGIGASTLIFSVLNSVLLRPLPLKHSENLYNVYHDSPRDGGTKIPLSFLDFRDWREQAKSLELSAVRSTIVSMGTADGPVRIGVLRSSANLTSVLDIQPSLGRAFRPEEETPGKEHVAILASGIWRTQFGGSPDVLGHSVTLDDKSYTIIGVVPGKSLSPEFVFSTTPIDIIVPLVPTQPEMNRGFYFLRVLGRLNPNETLSHSLSEMNSIKTRIEKENPTNHQGYRVQASPLKETVVGNVRPAILIVSAAVGALLLITCVNIANLMLARTLVRRNELAVRAALGASRRRIAGQLITEGLFLSTLGAILGGSIAFAMVGGTARWIGALLPRAGEIAIDFRVMLFTLLTATCAGVLFNLAPAMQSWQGSFAEGLTMRSRTSLTRFSSYVLRSLVVAQIALALLLLGASVLMIRSFRKLAAVSPGFVTEHLVASQVDLSTTRFPQTTDFAVFYNAALGKLRAVPGIQSVAVVSRVPMMGGLQSTAYQTEDHRLPPAEWPFADARMATPQYFSTMQIPLMSGRDFTDDDRQNTPLVIMVSHEAATRLWPKEVAVGKHIQIFPEKTWRTVVGVVGDVKLQNLETENGPVLYIPYNQNPFPNAGRSSYLVARTHLPPETTFAILRRELASIDDNQAIGRLRILTEVVSDSLSLRRFTSVLTTGFTVLALALALIGVYGVMSFSVNARRHDLGVRAALGAQKSQLLWWVLRQALVLTGIGIAGGLLLSVMSKSILAKVLYGLNTTEYATYLGISVVLVLMATLASYVPARRAAQVSPVAVLHSE